jgi:hypothetical protein
MVPAPGETQAALNALRWHWEKAYAVNCADGIWTAIPAASPETVLTAKSALAGAWLGRALAPRKADT